MPRHLARVLVLMLVSSAAGFVMLVPGAAGACACGGAYPLDGDELDAGDETVFLSRTADGRERMEMALQLTGEGTEVAVLIPTPDVPEVEQGAADRLAELDELSTPPPPEPEDHEGDGAGAPPAESAPEVVEQTVLDDVVATVLRGGTADGVVRWLADHGYEQKPAVEPVIAEYLADGWVFTAVKLRSDQPVTGEVDPIVLTFASEELVYPMRMSSVADDPGSVTAYVLGEDFVDLDAENEQSRTLVHAVRLDGDEVEDDVLQDLVAREDTALTRWRIEIRTPEALGDFRFVTDASIEAVAESPGDPGKDPADWRFIAAIVAVILTFAVALGVLLTILARRRP